MVHRSTKNLIFAFASASSAWAFDPGGKVLYHSRDAGQTWTALPPNPFFAALAYFYPGELTFVNDRDGWLELHSKRNGTAALLNTQDGGYGWGTVFPRY